MKNRKVLNFRASIGGLHGKTSFDAVKDKAEMELWPIGVYIKAINGVSKDILFPFPNVIEVHMSPEEPEEDKRGPGRPPGPRAA